MMQKMAIFGVPRSGTSWLSQIFNSHPEVVCRYQPLFSYAHKGAIDEESSSEKICQFYNDILHTRDEFVLMTSAFHKSYPSFNKSAEPTHIIFKETRYLNVVENILERCDDVKIYGITRNPFSVLASWVRAPKEFDDSWDIKDEWEDATSKNQGLPEEFYGYRKWKQVTLTFLRFQKRYPEQFFMVAYEDLVADTKGNVESMFDFCNLEMHKQVADYIDAGKSIHENDPYSVFRSKANIQKSTGFLPKEVISRINKDLINTPLESYLR